MAQKKEPLLAYIMLLKRIRTSYRISLIGVPKSGCHYATINSLFFLSPVHEGAAVLITVPQIYYCIETTASHEVFVYLFKLFEISLHISKDQREIKHNEHFVELNTF